MVPDHRRLLADLMLDWEDRFAEGVDTPAVELARAWPELVEELDRRIRALKATAWLERNAVDINDGHRSCDDRDPETLALIAGRYRLDELIGVGGFAEVWRGFDLKLQRTVAIKIPKSSAIRGSEGILEEARRVAALHHPGIVTVHDVGNDGSRWFIVSEFVSGGSLAARMDSGTITRDDAIRWACQVAGALEAAHQSGLVHRDVKPENILIDDADDALLADFGIAQPALSEGQEIAGIGSLRNMAPEQLAGGPVTPSTDVYALALVFHEMLSGGLPYASDTPNGIRGEIATGIAGRVSRVIPRRLAAVCRRALALDPGQRFPTAASFSAAVRRATRPARPLLMVTAVFMAGLVIAAVFVATRPEPPRNAVQQGDKRSIFVPNERPARLGADTAGRISLRFRQIADIYPYLVDAENVRMYYEWQKPPISYVGPVVNDAEGRVIYRFDVDRPIVAARLLCTVFCSDETVDSRVFGRGAGAVEVSKDGVEWASLCNTLEPLAWGVDHAIDESLPEAVLGGTSLWVRARLLTTGSRKILYTNAQFGRDFFSDFPALDGVFGLDLEFDE